MPKRHAAGDECWRHLNANNSKSGAVWIHSSAASGEGQGRTQCHQKNDPRFKSLKEHFDIMMHLGKVQATGVVAIMVDGLAGRANRDDSPFRWGTGTVTSGTWLGTVIRCGAIKMEPLSLKR